jgi:hypothetical protein
MNNYKGEVKTQGAWTTTTLIFAEKIEAEGYIEHLKWRWAAVEESRVVATQEPVTHKWDCHIGELHSLETGFRHVPPYRVSL